MTTPSGALVYAAFGPSRMMGMRGETIFINSVVDAVAEVPRGIVRLRLLNAANARNFDLRFTDSRTFHVIASDGGYTIVREYVAQATLRAREMFVPLSHGPGHAQHILSPPLTIAISSVA